MIWNDDFSAALPPMPRRWIRLAILVTLNLATSLIIVAGTSWGGGTMKPTRAKPCFEGVAGCLVDAAPAGLLFGERKLRTSPYDPLLLQLKAAGAGKFLRFEDLRARVSVVARAKKLGIRVSFGEEGNILWVTLSQADLVTNGAVPEDPRKTLADLVLDAIDAKRYTSGEITTWLRSNGAPGAGISQVDGLLSNLARANKVRIKSKPDESERWAQVIRLVIVPVIVERRKIAAAKPLPKKIPVQSARPVQGMLRRVA